MPPIYIVVLREDADLERVSRELEDLGFRISRHLKYLNTIIVEGPEENVPKIAEIEGVKAVDKNRKVRPRRTFLTPRI